MKKIKANCLLTKKKYYLKLDIIFLIKHKKLIYCINVKYSHSVGVNFNKCDLVNWICRICATDLTILWNQKFRILLFQIWSTKIVFYIKLVLWLFIKFILHFWHYSIPISPFLSFQPLISPTLPYPLQHSCNFCFWFVFYNHT